ncbi:hypothetical protein ACFWIB_41450, partial [Streptomyces sp. NPDC127051]|uniref:hypothetical protein n=1 Tax=Streptomyces sp. NPDC127051 TaxID=3347119 RepID=UPI00364B79A9
SLFLFNGFWTMEDSRVYKKTKDAYGPPAEKPWDNFTFAGEKLSKKQLSCLSPVLASKFPALAWQAKTNCSTGNIDLSYTLFGTRPSRFLENVADMFATDERELAFVSTDPHRSEGNVPISTEGQLGSYWTVARKRVVFDWTVSFLKMQYAYTSGTNCLPARSDITSNDIREMTKAIYDRALVEGLIKQEKKNPSSRTSDLVVVKYVDPNSRLVDSLEAAVDNGLAKSGSAFSKLSKGAQRALIGEKSLASSLHGVAAGTAITNIIETHQDPGASPLDYTEAYLNLGVPVSSLASRGFGMAGAGTASNVAGRAGGALNAAVAAIGFYKGYQEQDYVKMGIKALAFGVAIASIAVTGIGIPIAAVLGFIVSVADLIWELAKPKWVGQEARLEKFRQEEVGNFLNLKVLIDQESNRFKAMAYQKKRMYAACNVPVADQEAPTVAPLDGIITIKGLRFPTKASGKVQNNVIYAGEYPDHPDRFDAKEVNVRLFRVMHGKPMETFAGGAPVAGVDTAFYANEGLTDSTWFEYKVISVDRRPPGVGDVQEFTLQIKIKPGYWPRLDNDSTRDWCYDMNVILGKYVVTGPGGNPPRICANNTSVPVQADLVTPDLLTPSDAVPAALTARLSSSSLASWYFAYTYKIE